MTIEPNDDDRDRVDQLCNRMQASFHPGVGIVVAEAFAAHRIAAEKRAAELDAEKIIAWINDENRKPAELAFTSGPDRQVADLIEYAEKLQRERIAKLEAIRVAWRKAARRLYDECVEGGSQGRPMDLFSRKDWNECVALLGAAADLENELFTWVPGEEYE